MERVVIQEHSEEENISLEKQAEMQEEAAKARGQSIKSETEQVEDTETPIEDERPEWLPEKFESAEDMAKAYSALEKKQSDSQEKKEEKASKEEPASPSNEVITNATEEFTNNGELSDKTYEGLAKAGLPREMVDAYIAGQQSLVDAQTSAIHETVGGLSEYEAMAKWAGENLADEELDAYNTIVESGTTSQATVAVKGLYAQYKSLGGGEPSLEKGGTSASDAGVKPFGSAAEVTRAMRDAKYAEDAGYRKLVEQRLAVTTAI
jgi:hypothetical protein